MSDELKLRRELERADRAKRLLGDEMLNEAFAALEKSYLDVWRGTHNSEADFRERLWIAVRVIECVRAHLAQVAASGFLADAHLKELKECAERQSRRA